MKIVFWGAGRGCGTTSSMTAVAGFLALVMNCRGICMQPKTGSGDLETFFCSWEKSSVFREESTYYALEGMDYLIWQEQHHRLDAAATRESVVPLFDHRLFYLPCGSREKPSLYPVQTGELQQRIMARMEEFVEFVFIDVGSERDDFTYRLLKQADVVVVNFSGEQKELEQFFASPLPFRGTVLYLLANYSSDQVYNCENLQRIYRMDRRSICYIPANPYFAQACAKGRVEQYMKACCRGRRYDPCHGQFLKGLKQVANLILEAGANE